LIRYHLFLIILNIFNLKGKGDGANSRGVE
jgi:hypothetical protein